MHILQVTPSTRTRLRGQEAGREVVARLRAEAVALDFHTTSPSLSFLEGLVVTLHASRALPHVTLVTEDATIRERLARIAGKRGVTIFVRQPVQPHRERVTPVDTPRVALDTHLGQARGHSQFAHV